MKRYIVFIFLVIQLAQLYIMWSFWQMDKRFVESTQLEQPSDKDKEQTQYAL